MKQDTNDTTAVEQTTVAVTDATVTDAVTNVTDKVKAGEEVSSMLIAATLDHLSKYEDNPPATAKTGTDGKGITLLSAILSRPKNPNVFEKFGRKSTIAVDILVPIIMANGVTIQVPAALWGRLTVGEHGLKTVFDFAVGKGIGLDDDNKLLSNSIKRQISEWEGWALASSEAHRRLTTGKAKVETVDLDYSVPVKPGVEGYRAPRVVKAR